MPTRYDLAMFIEMAQTHPEIYVAIVTTVIISVTLHELAHGWVATWQGDDTPRVLGHLTPNPIVHMGVVSIVLAFLAGIAWGQMPVDPRKFRSRYGDAYVSFAGPAMNILLAIVGFTGLALWSKHLPSVEDIAPLQANLVKALWYFGMINIALAIFNMIPVPPLDGSRIMANLNHGYARWLQENAELSNFLFFGVFALVSSINKTPYGLHSIATRVGDWYMGLLGADKSYLLILMS